MKVTAKRFRWILIGLLGLIIVIFLASAAEGLGKLSRQSQQLVATKLKAKKAEAQLSSLIQAKKQVERYGYFNDVAKTVIPNDKDQARAVLEIYRMASQSGIAIGSVTFPTSTLSASSAISQAQPVEGIEGLYSLELSIIPKTGPQTPENQVATYPKFLDFLSRIERNRRTAQITQISIQPQGTSANNPEIDFTLTINIFIRPQK